MSEPRSVWHVVGARPNFPKAAPVIRALAGGGTSQVLVHTGQHYDAALSDSFLTALGMPSPDINLAVGSGSHAQQTAAVLVAMEDLLVKHRPDLLVVYGDVNSTLGAALAAAKVPIPVAHVEAGLRSFDDSMPEEINRRLTDQVSTLLFATCEDAVTNLAAEGISGERVRFVGNPMIDSLLAQRDSLDPDTVCTRLGLPARYVAATLHRPANVDDPAAVAALVHLLHGVADYVPLVIPLHPRARTRLVEAGLADHPALVITDPLGYHDFLSLMLGAAAVITDSGGVQEETTVLGVPCLTLRPNTERPVTIALGTNQLVTPATLPEALHAVLAHPPLTVGTGSLPLWDGEAGPRIAATVTQWLDRPEPGLARGSAMWASP